MFHDVLFELGVAVELVLFIAETFDPLDKRVEISRIGGGLVPLRLVDDLVKVFGQGDWLVSKVIEVGGEEDVSPAEIGISVAFMMDSGTHQWVS